uniref:INTS5_C domain-containing protein n=1 Tax=Heterorhabditis bacteriophora TaxID=37862 RepID=A0A1I7XML7_HETBA
MELLVAMQALLLSDVLCQDALSGDYIFSEWDLEKEVISRYLEVSNRLDNTWICGGLLDIIAQATPCLWFTLPVLKAKLAALLIQFESAADKSHPPSSQLIDRFDSWMFLVRRGDVLPSRFELALDLIPYVSSYDGFLLLLEMWKYFQRRSISFHVINAAYKAALKGETIEMHGQLLSKLPVASSGISRGDEYSYQLDPPYNTEGDTYGNVRKERAASCARNEFACVKSSSCIPASKRCDGIADDCADGSNFDEIDCNRNSTCVGKFMCHHSVSGPFCIDWVKHCDGEKDCSLGEDEANCSQYYKLLFYDHFRINRSRNKLFNFFIWYVHFLAQFLHILFIAEISESKYLLCENQKQAVTKDQWCNGETDCTDESDEKYCN